MNVLTAEAQKCPTSVRGVPRTGPKSPPTTERPVATPGPICPLSAKLVLPGQTKSVPGPGTPVRSPARQLDVPFAGFGRHRLAIVRTLSGPRQQTVYRLSVSHDRRQKAADEDVAAARRYAGDKPTTPTPTP